MSNHILSELLGALAEETGEVSPLLLAKTLRVSQSTVTCWRGGATPRRANMRKILTYFRDFTAASLVMPVLEYKAIAPVKSGRTWALTKVEEDIALLHACMLHRPGLFLLYDSTGSAIFLGKSESCLYTETRKRLGDHSNRPFFSPNRNKPPHIGELASYISVYEVSVLAALDNIEAFMLRAFGNNLLNEDAGNFKASIKRGI